MSESQRKKTLVSWSSGKDSTWMFHVLRSRRDVEIVGLLTTVTGPFQRVSMHGTPLSILRAQAEALGTSLMPVEIPYPCPNETYERAMASCLDEARAAGVEQVAFGDLYLEDVRAYREAKMEGTGLTLIFPIWGEDTTKLAHRIIEAGIEAIVTCIDPKVMDPSFAGRVYDAQFLDDLPPGVDPCGENGEFHSVVAAGPDFAHRLPLRVAGTVERDGFVFADCRLDGDG